VAQKVFISYRRADSATISGRIYDRLVLKFGRKNVFKDVDDIPAGVNFGTYIQASLRQCAVMLVIIGPDWAGTADGGRRLDSATDWVRVEVETAFSLGLTIIPLLVGDASMPPAAILPDSFHELAGINSLRVRDDPDFATDIARAITAIDRAFTARPASSGRRGTPVQAAQQEQHAAPSAPEQSRVQEVQRRSPTPGARARPPLFGALALVVIVTSLGVALATHLLSGGPRGTTGGHPTSTSTGAGGLKAGVGIDVQNKTISLGILTPLSGATAAPVGTPLTRGMEIYFQYFNDNLSSTIGGYKIKLVERDTKYDPATQVTQYNDIHNNVLMIAESLGTATTYAIKDLATQDHMLVAAATGTSSLAREKYLYLVGTPYRLQVENAFDYIVNRLGKTAPKTGIIYQNDDYGQDGLTGYQESISAYGLRDVGQKPYNAASTDFTAQVSALMNAGATYVFLAATAASAAQIIGTGAALGYTPQWILQSPAWTPALLAIPAMKGLLEAHAWVVEQGADWGDTTKPGMAELLNNLQKYAVGQSPDVYFQWGYTIARIDAAILQKAFANNDLTRDGMVKALESLNHVDLGGLYPPVTYGSLPGNQRVPTRDSTINAVDHTQPTGLKDISSGDFTGTAANASSF
jgi:ABC-type branched-subunit amino acid transport system substrate-binding protein